MKKKLLQKNKFKMAIGTIIVAVIVGALAAFGLDVPDDVKADILKIVIWIIGIVGGGSVAVEGHIDAKAVHLNGKPSVDE